MSTGHAARSCDIVKVGLVINRTDNYGESIRSEHYYALTLKEIK
jgi:hypothetical protein